MLEIRLVVAARKGHRDVVQQLLEAGADKESKGKYGATALMWAAENGHQDVVRELLQSGAENPDLPRGK